MRSSTERAAETCGTGDDTCGGSGTLERATDGVMFDDTSRVALVGDGISNNDNASAVKVKGLEIAGARGSAAAAGCFCGARRNVVERIFEVLRSTPVVVPVLLDAALALV